MKNLTAENSKVAHGLLRQDDAALTRDTFPGKSRVSAVESVGTYDELDYRLMATFPASDATARY